MRSQIPLLGGQSTHRIAKIKDEQTINWFAKQESPDAKSQITLEPTPGLTKLSTVATGPARCNPIVWGSYLYGISGNTLWKKDTSDVFTTLGTLSTSAGWCYITKGRTMIAIVDGTAGYTYNGTTFATITDVDFPNGATHIDYLDGYFIVNKPATDQFYISASEDATSWNPLDFASAEASPDDISALIVHSRSLYLAGSDTIQIFYNSGNASFPYSPYPNVIEYGIDAANSMVHDDSGIYLLAIRPGGGKVPVKIQGFQGVPLADPDITWTINQFTTTSDAIGAIYDKKGEAYYVLTFPSQDITYEWNLQTNECNRLKSYGIGRHRALGYGSQNGRQFVGDYTNAKIYELDFAKYTEDGDTIERYRRTRVVASNDQYIIHHEIVVDILSGVGNASSANPIMQLRYSDDGGNNWSSWLDMSMGATGEYYVRCTLRKLGPSRDRVYEFRVTDPVLAVVIAIYGDLEVLAA